VAPGTPKSESPKRIRVVRPAEKKSSGDLSSGAAKTKRKGAEQEAFSKFQKRG